MRRLPFPSEWRRTLADNMPCFRLLDGEERAELEGHIQVFLAEKTFEGCAGLAITDEIRVTVAGQACLLLLHRKTDYYPSLHSVLVYPHRYGAEMKRQQPDGSMIEGMEVRSGESWLRGAVVLSWDEVLDGGKIPGDGRNVVLHEFAHQLDGESGAMEGVPGIEGKALVKTWAKVMPEEFELLKKELAENRPSLLGPYAATSPAEFFAVSVERFFERPRTLKTRHPRLYSLLAQFFRR